MGVIYLYREMLKSKIHRATVTDANLNYVGSVTIDKELMEHADILPNEKVHIVNINNGARFETYVIEGERGSGMVCLNGAAARLVQPGDLVIIISYSFFKEDEIFNLQSKAVLVDEENKLKELIEY